MDRPWPPSISALSLGALSALALWRDRSAEDFRAAGTAERGRGRIRQTLIAVEVALAVALMVGAALFGQSLLRLQRVDVGFDTSRLLTFDIMLTGQRAEYMSKQMEFYNGVLDRTRALPGVVSAAGAFTLPIGGDDFGASAFPEGRPFRRRAPIAESDFRSSATSGSVRWACSCAEGRDFSSIDKRESTKVVIVNQALAGHRMAGAESRRPSAQVRARSRCAVADDCGVVSNIHHMGPGAPPRPEIYLPYSQMSQAMMAVAVRTTGDPTVDRAGHSRGSGGGGPDSTHFRRQHDGGASHERLWTRAIPDDLDDVVWRGDVSVDGGRGICRDEFRRHAANEGIRRACSAGCKSGPAGP